MESRAQATRLRRSIAAHVLLVWFLFGMVALAILITYARLPAAETYHVSKEGLAGGAGRALVFVNFPTAFAAIALAGVSVARLRASARFASTRSRVVLITIAIVATGMCLVTAAPGVVDQSDLDAKLVNLIPAAGVLIALGLSVLAIRAATQHTELEWTGRDRFGAMLVAALFVLSLPWILAEIGIYVDEVPVLGWFFIASEIPEGATLAAVHLGHHHGLDGFLLVTTALVLGRPLRANTPGRLDSALRAYLSVMFGYGIANLANDLWLEQVVKRGWTEHSIPSYLRPEITPAWGLLIIGMVVFWFALFRPEERAYALALETT